MWSLISIPIAPKHWVDAKLMHLVDKNDKVMAEKLAQGAPLASRRYPPGTSDDPNPVRGDRGSSRGIRGAV
ncbi:MAG TPA: hypothetical protein VMR80_14355, partial [Candidatus Acidoferrum sp.]|nr:hypothetical protein [Candidatus Acidoferrum sp.]